MTAVKMQKGRLVTHVYNDPKTIADARKKGFRLVGEAEAAETRAPAEPLEADKAKGGDGATPEAPSDSLAKGSETDGLEATQAEAEAAETRGARGKRKAAPATEIA